MEEPGEKKIICVLCKVEIEEDNVVNTLGKTGVASIQNAAKQRNDTVTVEVGQKVHVACRRDYIHKRSVTAAVRGTKAANPTHEPVRRSVDGGFNFRTQCVYCKSLVTYRSRKRGHDVHQVRTTKFSDELKKICQNRNDNWAHEVLARIEYAQDLFAWDTLYHHQCDSNFRRGMTIPMDFSNEPPAKVGRKLDEIRDAAFQKVISYLEENDDEQITLTELCDLMDMYLKEEECGAYSQRYMKKRLLDTLTTDRIVITTIKGKENVVTFREQASRILLDFHAHDLQDEESCKLAIIEACAKLLKSDIRAIEQNTDIYPDTSDMADIEKALAFLPVSLRHLLQMVIVGTDADLHTASLGQAIMQRCRPRMLICPLQLGYSVQLHHHFGSRFEVDTASRMGFGVSYSEVQRYEANAATSGEVILPKEESD